MKIAVPSDDGVGIAPHFGRSTAFLVFDIQEDAIASTELRPNDHAGHHDHSSCSHTQERAHEHKHDHSRIVTLLSDCSVVLTAGMGWRAAEALKQANIVPLMMQDMPSARAAVEKYIEGTLITSDSFCRCHP